MVEEHPFSKQVLDYRSTETQKIIDELIDKKYIDVSDVPEKFILKIGARGIL